METMGLDAAKTAAFAAALASIYQQYEQQRQAIATANGGAVPTRDQVNQWAAELATAQQAAEAAQKAQVDSFLQFLLQPQYVAGMVAVGGTWTAMHATALASLVADAAGDFARVLAEATRRAQVTIRDVRRSVAADDVEAFGRALDRNQITHVVYANGHTVPVAVWADMEAKTKLAVAYNAGVLNTAVQQGVTHVEVSDGSACGWKTHDDPDKADGSVRTVEEAAAFPISHPRCQRTFTPRFDVQVENPVHSLMRIPSPQDLPRSTWDLSQHMAPRPAQVAREARAAKRQDRVSPA